MTTPSRTPSKSGLSSASASAAPRLSRHTTPTHSSSSLPRASLAPPTPSAQKQHEQSMQETYTVLGDLTHEFKNTADEFALLHRLAAKKTEIAALIRSKHAAMKGLVEGLCGQVAQLHALTEQPAAIGLQQQYSVLQQQRDVVSGQIANMLAEIEKLEAAGVQMEKQKAQLLQQKSDAEQAKARKMPAMAGTMGLYRNFSSIEWDYDSAPDAVKGTFHFDGKASAASLKAFSFDKATTSDFDIASDLWTMMEAAQQ